MIKSQFHKNTLNSSIPSDLTLFFMKTQRHLSVSRFAERRRFFDLECRRRLFTHKICIKISCILNFWNYIIVNSGNKVSIEDLNWEWISLTTSRGNLSRRRRIPSGKRKWKTRSQLRRHRKIKSSNPSLYKKLRKRDLSRVPRSSQTTITKEDETGRKNSNRFRWRNLRSKKSRFPWWWRPRPRCFPSSSLTNP